MLTSVYETLRSAGRELVARAGRAADLDARSRTSREAARCLADDPAATDAAARGGGAGARARRVRDAARAAARPQRRCGRAASAPRATRRRASAVEQAALDELRARDRELLQELLDGSPPQYAAAKDRESALDFEDLQLRARDLLRDDESLREREQLRFRSIMVDEFQDTNRLQCELIDLLAGAGHGASSSSATSSSRSTASATRTCRSSASAARSAAACCR